MPGIKGKAITGLQHKESLKQVNERFTQELSEGRAFLTTQLARKKIAAETPCGNIAK